MLLCGDQGFSLYHQQIDKELNTLWITKTMLYKAGALSSAVSTTLWNPQIIVYLLNMWVLFLENKFYTLHTASHNLDTHKSSSWVICCYHLLESHLWREVTSSLFHLSHASPMGGHLHIHGPSFRVTGQTPGLFWSCLCLVSCFFPLTSFTSGISIFIPTGLASVMRCHNCRGHG